MHVPKDRDRLRHVGLGGKKIKIKIGRSNPKWKPSGKMTTVMSIHRLGSVWQPRITTAQQSLVTLGRHGLLADALKWE